MNGTSARLGVPVCNECFVKVKQDTKDYDKKLYRQSVRGNVKGLQVEMGMYLNCFSRVQS